MCILTPDKSTSYSHHDDILREEIVLPNVNSPSSEGVFLQNT